MIVLCAWCAPERVVVRDDGRPDGMVSHEMCDKHLAEWRAAASAGQESPCKRAGMRILIADDEPVVAEVLRLRVEALGHHVLAVAHDGREAAEMAEGAAPDLIFLDIKMPELDGIAATERIMATRPVPIILVTAHSDEALVNRAIAAGVMGYLVKPVDPENLAPAIALATARFAGLMALRRG
jgi:response regulator NasT